MFNEENTVEQMVLDTFCGGVPSNMVAAKLTCLGHRIMILLSQDGERAEI
ncbi:MAG: hypothetical protein OEL83_07240 [Desulforhopalus sp.]|nr:hypothetical protein [Desulforhopalus sp.]